MKKKVLIAGCFVFLVAGFTVWKSSAIGQRLGLDRKKSKEVILNRIDRASDVEHRVVENTDTPLRIAEAKVKVISGEELTVLTGKATNFESLSSLPDLKVWNSSDKVIAGFMLMFRDPILESSRIISFNNLKMEPGETYSVLREDMISSPVTTVAGELGARLETRSKKESEKYWITTGEQARSYVTVGKVVFADGSTWMITEGGELR